MVALKQLLHRGSQRKIIIKATTSHLLRGCTPGENVGIGLDLNPSKIVLDTNGGQVALHERISQLKGKPVPSDCWVDHFQHNPGKIPLCFEGHCVCFTRTYLTEDKRVCVRCLVQVLNTTTGARRWDWKFMPTGTCLPVAIAIIAG